MLHDFHNKHSHGGIWNCNILLNYIGSQRRSRRSYSVVAVIQIVELELGFLMVQFSSKNIDVSKSYGQNSTEGKWGSFEVVVSSDWNFDVIKISRQK